MQRLAACRLRRGHDVRDVEVAGRARGRADADCVVGQLDVQRLLVGGRVDGDRLDPELVERAHDAHRDLAPVRDEDTREHGGRP